MAASNRSRIPPWAAVLLLAGAAAAWGGIYLRQARRTPAQQHLAAGDALAQRGQGLRALAEWEEAARLDPKSADIWQVLGQSYYDGHRWDRARQALQRAAALAPRTPRLHAQIAWCALQQNAPEDALVAARAELALDPASVAAHDALVAAQSRLGDTEDALRSLRRLAELEPDRVARHSALAQALLSRNAVAEVLSVTDRILALDPTRSEAYAQRGLARFYTSSAPDSLARAESDFTKALEGKPDIYEAHLYLGRIHKRRGQWAPAAAALARATQLRPDKADAYYDLAAVYERTGDTRRAADARRRFQSIVRAAEQYVHLKKQADLAPDNVDLQRRAGLLALQRGDVPAAYHYLNRALQQRPDDPEVRAALERVARVQP